MSRGNYFVSLNTQHYFYIPKFYRFGLSYLDSYAYNALRSPSNPIAQRAREITEHPYVNIYGNSYNMSEWLEFHLGVTSFSWEYFDLSGNKVSDSAPTGRQGLYGITVGDIINYLEGYYGDNYAQQAKDLRDGTAMAKKIQSIRTSIQGYAQGTDIHGQIFRLFLPQPNANRTDRTVASKGTNLINAVPRRASGAKYHARGTAKEDPGVYVGDDNLSVNDHAATVAGTLKLKWNNVQKVYESGQTFLAILLTDVDGANIVNSGFGLDNIEGVTSEDFYGADAPHKMFDFTTGIAMPLGLESAQPQSFGPNIIKCAGETKAETIRVVNRSKTNYSKGEYVIIHQIDGENIIGGKFTQEVLEQRPPEPKRWNFTKFFANSDEYFRLDIGLDNNLVLQTPRPLVTPAELVDILYQRYYFHDQGDVYNYLDDKATSVILSRIPDVKLFEYYQTHISDIAPYLSRRINIYVDPAGGPNVGTDNVDQTDVPLFFGPMFPDGTTSIVELDDGTTYDKLQTPGEYVYPFMYNAHGAIRHINSGNYKYTYTDEYTTSGIVPTSDLTRVQFSLCSCELFGAGDLTSFQLPTQIADIGRFGAANTKPRRFPKTIEEITNGRLQSANAGILTAPAIARRGGNGLTVGKVKDKFDNGAMAAFYRGFSVINEAQIANIVPFDAYIDHVPLNSPRNAPALFGGDTGPESSVGVDESVFFGGTPGQYVGSNAVGVISSRLRMNQGSGGSWVLGVEVDQTFGMKGRFYGGGGGGGIVTTIIGAMMAFANDNRGRTIQGSVPMWGSTKGDSIDSFGTAACHIQVWDAWPDEDTTWIPQYMCALHFNPKIEREIYNKVTNEMEKNAEQWTSVTVKNYAYATKDSNGDWISEPKDYEISIPNPSLVSYKVPTWGDTVEIKYTNTKGDEVKQTYDSYGTGSDGQGVGLGTLISEGSKLRPQNLWNTVTQREGKLVTKHGYHWFKRVIGLHDRGPTATNSLYDEFYDIVTEKEEGFKDGENHIYTVGRGQKEVRFWVDGSRIVFDEIEWMDNAGSKNKEKVRGEGYLPSDLPVRYTITDTDGKTATVVFKHLLCYDKHYHDVGPQPRSSLQRVTLSSGQGTERMWGPSSASINVEGNKLGADTDLTLYSGQYEILVYVHNDIGFAWHKPPEETTGYAMAQFITVKLQ